VGRRGGRGGRRRGRWTGGEWGGEEDWGGGVGSNPARRPPAINDRQFIVFVTVQLRGGVPRLLSPSGRPSMVDCTAFSGVTTPVSSIQGMQRESALVVDRVLRYDREI